MPLRTVLAVAAESFELAGILRRARAVETWDAGLRFARRAELPYGRLLAVAHGPGRKLAGEAMEKVREQVDAIVSVGMCGGLRPDLEVNDIFVADAVNGRPVAVPEPAPVHARGPLVCVDHVVQTSREKAELFRQGFGAVDMESAAVADGAARREAAFYCVRVVSDAARDSFVLDLNACRDAQGRFSVPRILFQAARRPITVIPELARLNSRAKAASDRLGAFFVDCRF